MSTLHQFDPVIKLYCIDAKHTIQRKPKYGTIVLTFQIDGHIIYTSFNILL